MSQFMYSFTLNGCRERGMGKGAALSKEAVLAASGRAGEKSDVFNSLLEDNWAIKQGSAP